MKQLKQIKNVKSQYYSENYKSQEIMTKTNPKTQKQSNSNKLCHVYFQIEAKATKKATKKQLRNTTRQKTQLNSKIVCLFKHITQLKKRSIDYDKPKTECAIVKTTKNSQHINHDSHIAKKQS